MEPRAFGLGAKGAPEGAKGAKRGSGGMDLGEFEPELFEGGGLGLFLAAWQDPGVLSDLIRFPQDLEGLIRFHQDS